MELETSQLIGASRHREAKNCPVDLPDVKLMNGLFGLLETFLVEPARLVCDLIVGPQINQSLDALLSEVPPSGLRCFG